MKTEATVQIACTSCGSVVRVRSDERHAAVKRPKCGSRVDLGVYADYLKVFDAISRIVDR